MVALTTLFAITIVSSPRHIMRIPSTGAKIDVILFIINLLMGACYTKKKLTPESTIFRSYETELGHNNKLYVYPQAKELNHDRYIVGVSQHPDEIAF